MPKLTLTEDEVKALVEGFDIDGSELEDIDEHTPELGVVIRKVLKAAGVSAESEEAEAADDDDDDDGDVSDDKDAD